LWDSCLALLSEMFGTDSADCDCDDGEVDENSRGETDEYCLGDVLAGVVDLLGDRRYEVVSLPPAPKQEFKSGLLY